MSLSEKHKAFVEEYLQCWSASEAYRRVYPKAKKNTSWSGACALMRKHEVREEIENRLKTMRMSANEVLARLSDQARASLLPFLSISKDGYASFDFSTPEARDSLINVKRLAIKQDGEIVIEVVDSQSALEKLGKHHKLFNDRMEVTHVLNVEGYERMLDRIYGKRDDTSG